MIMVMLTAETNILKNYLNTVPMSFALTTTVCIYYLYFSVSITGEKNYFYNCFLLSILRVRSIFIYVYLNDFVDN